MNRLAILSLVASLLYVGIGAIAIQKAPRASVNRVFTAICLALMFWSFGFAFMYAAPDVETCWAWDRFASMGWSTVPALSLHFTWVLACGGRRRGRWWTPALLYAPAVYLFVGYQLKLPGVDIQYQRLDLGWTPTFDNMVGLYMFYQVYIVGYFAAALLVLIRWLRGAVGAAERKQARAVVIAASVAVTICFLVDQAAELVVGRALPPLAPILGLVWAVGISWAMTRHGFLVLSPAVASDLILESVQDMVLLVDPSGRMVDVNSQAAEALGYDRADLVDAAFGVVLGDEEKARKAIAAIRDVQAQAVPLDVAWICRDGRELPVWMSGGPIYDREGEAIGVVVVGRDLSERRRAEDTLVRASRVESLAILSGGIVHDLNNLLAVVLGNLGLARAAAAALPVACERLDAAEKAAEQTQRLVQRLLTVSRGESPVRREVDLLRLVRESATMSFRGSNVRFEVAAAGNLRPLRVDEGQIAQVLQNLFINARQAMPAGGRVLVELSIGPLAGTGGSGDATLPGGNFACVAVRDEGPGIPSDKLSRIFEPFFTTKTGGSGLGLASSLSIARRHGGTLTVDCPPEGGSVFRLFLPAGGAGADAKEGCA